MSLAQKIELKIPPPIIGFLSAVFMWFIGQHTIKVIIDSEIKTLLCGVFFLVGLLFDSTSLFRFFQKKTTINPLKPAHTTQLVTTGIYSISRNPMYLGLLFILMGWFFYLAAPLSFLGIIFYMIYITRFQIIPEEKILASLFGDQFTDYKKATRRWI